MAARVDQGLRKDAAENRERLLAAASELFAERGLGVTLNDIAHHAGVGVGTAYRRFPNKEALIDALFEKRLQAVVDVAQEALDDPDAWNGLLTFLERALSMRHGDRGLDEIMNNRLLGDERVSQVRDRIAPIITKLVAKAKRQGVVRPDFDQSDLIFIQLALSAITEATRDVSPALYRRYLTLFLDGIRTDRSTFTPLPAPALSAVDTHRVFTRRRRPA
jgi:AcrR family transcriptional regulator